MLKESCGLKFEIREPSPVEERSTAKMFGLDFEGHLPKGRENCDLAKTDLILAMESCQFRGLIELFSNKRRNIRLLREYSPFPEKLLCNINDPFGQYENVFEKCSKQIERSVVNIQYEVYGSAKGVRGNSVE